MALVCLFIVLLMAQSTGVKTTSQMLPETISNSTCNHQFSFPWVVEESENKALLLPNVCSLAEADINEKLDDIVSEEIELVKPFLCLEYTKTRAGHSKPLVSLYKPFFQKFNLTLKYFLPVEWSDVTDFLQAWGFTQKSFSCAIEVCESFSLPFMSHFGVSVVWDCMQFCRYPVHKF